MMKQEAFAVDVPATSLSAFEVSIIVVSTRGSVVKTYSVSIFWVPLEPSHSTK